MFVVVHADVKSTINQPSDSDDSAHDFACWNCQFELLLW